MRPSLYSERRIAVSAGLLEPEKSSRLSLSADQYRQLPEAAAKVGRIRLAYAEDQQAGFRRPTVADASAFVVAVPGCRGRGPQFVMASIVFGRRQRYGPGAVGTNVRPAGDAGIDKQSIEGVVCFVDAENNASGRRFGRVHRGSVDGVEVLTTAHGCLLHPRPAYL
jgi:hypothetical protein